MPRYLLAAEADKIQDFIFRAAKLREVVGGSSLLSQFCDEGVKELKKKHGNKAEIIVSDGGAFRLVFDNEIKAKEFGNDLAELYRRCAGGTLTVAEPVECDETKFKEQFSAYNKEAQEKLREAKNRGDVAAMAVHLPYIAFCASCGTAIAAKHQRKIQSDENEPANYLCPDCGIKTEEAYQRGKYFIDLFCDKVREGLPPEIEIKTDYIEQNKKLQRKRQRRPDWAEIIGEADARKYVAYLKADGNNMGKVFGECDSQQLGQLSKALTIVVRESLASPCALMFKRQEQLRKDVNDFLPVVPLILGGDDLFALLPAPFALDFAAQFCQAYEEKLSDVLKELEINLSADKKPTIAAAVVICKNSYPHTLAHERAEAALKRAKEMARRIEVKTGKRVSTLNFDIVTGNQVVADNADSENEYRATLRPYFINDAPSDWGINIEKLIDARFSLKALPGKRRSEFERLYAGLPQNDKVQELSAWCKEFNQLRKRLKPDDETKFKTALENLGDAKREKDCYLRGAQRVRWHGHGLPDLLETWDFAYKLDKAMNAYEEE
jgi:CRISPR/Cas system-associated protein Cas10 (large subunit of type III CRISPR-Cas system)